MKKILFPLFIVIFAFIAINFIRPAILSALDQRIAKEVKLAELAMVEKTATNIGALSGSRKAILESEDGTLLMTYLPTKVDQDRIVDILNYAALKTGTVIGGISFEAGKAPREVALAEQVVGADGIAIATPPPTPIPSSFSMKLNAGGTYDSLKSFMEQVSTVNRLQRVTAFSLTKKDKVELSAGETATSEDEDKLSADFEVSFLYLPESVYPGAHLLPMFESGAIDTSSVKRLMESKEIIPALPEPMLPERRVDPFGA